MQINEIQVGQQVSLKGSTGTVTRVTRCRVFVHIDGRLPEIVSPRSLKPLEEEAEKLSECQELWLEACRVGYTPRDIQPQTSQWGLVDVVAACVSATAVAFMAWMPYWF